MSLLTLKSANGLKTIYIDTFDKVLDLLDQKYHFLETFDNKTQKMVYKTKTLNPNRKKKTCAAFNTKKANLLKTSYDGLFDKVLDFCCTKVPLSRDF